MAHPRTVRVGSLSSKNSSFQHGRMSIPALRPQYVPRHRLRLRTISARLPSRTDGADVTPSASRSACIHHIPKMLSSHALTMFPAT